MTENEPRKQKTYVIVSRVDIVKIGNNVCFVLNFDTKIGIFEFKSDSFSKIDNNIVSVNESGVEQFLQFIHTFNLNSISELAGMPVVIEYNVDTYKLVSVSHFIDDRIRMLFQKVLDTIST